MNKTGSASERNYLQEVVVDSITSILNRYDAKDFESDYFVAVIEIIRNALIRQYAEHPRNAPSTWQKIKAYKEYFLWSPRAIRAYKNAIELGVDEKKVAHSKKDGGKLHFEHIVPNDMILQELLSLKAIRKTKAIMPDEVKAILDLSEIAILANDEAAWLDGDPNKHTYAVEGVGEKLKGCGKKKSGWKEERLKEIGIDMLVPFGTDSGKQNS